MFVKKWKMRNSQIFRLTFKYFGIRISVANAKKTYQKSKQETERRY